MASSDTNPPQPNVPPPITDVPPEEVGDTVQGFIDFDQVKKMEVKIQPDGTFTVTPQPLDNSTGSPR